MADGRLRVVRANPGAIGVASALLRVARDGAVVTSPSDVRLRSLFGVRPEEFDLEFLSLGDLAGRFLTMAGQVNPGLPGAVQLQAMISFVAGRINEPANFCKSLQTPRGAARFAKTLGQLRDWNLDPTDLPALIGDLPASLASRLQAVATIGVALQEELTSRNLAFAHDRLVRCAQINERVPFPIRHVVYVADDEEVPAAEAWLKWLAGQGVQVDVILEWIPGRENLFIRSQRVVARLGADVLDGADLAWNSHLFQESRPDRLPALTVYETPDTLSEAEWAIRRFLKLQAAGDLPTDFAIYAPGASEYGPLLRASGDRLGMPVSVTMSLPMLGCGLAEFVKETLETLTGSDVRRLGNLASWSYLGLSHAQIEEVWALVRSCHASSGSDWDRLAAAIPSEGEDWRWLRLLVEWRTEATSEPVTLGHWLGRLRRLVGELPIDQAVLNAPQVVADRDKRVQTGLQRVLSLHASAPEDDARSVMSLAEFARKAFKLWEASTVTVTPAGHDVPVATDPMELAPARALAVLGMLEGSIPRRQSEDPVLSDGDREFLREATGGRACLPTSRDRARAERDAFVRVCGSASERIDFSYPATEDERDNVPTLYLEEVERIMGGEPERVRKLRRDSPPDLAEATAPADRRLREALDRPWADFNPSTVVAEIAKSRIRPDWEEGISLGEAVRAAFCPFQSACHDRLGLEPRTREIGTAAFLRVPVEAKLGALEDLDQARFVLMTEIEQQIGRLLPRMEPWEVTLAEQAARRLITEWVERERDSREKWGLDPRTVRADANMGEPPFRNEIPTDEGPVLIRGTVPFATTVKGQSLVTLYRGSTPATEEDLIGDPELLMRIGLLMIIQSRASSRPIVAIDAMRGDRSGTRVAYQLESTEGKTLKTIDQNRSVEIGRTRRELFGDVQGQLAEVRKRLETADMVATPSPSVCKNCGFGELCRRHAEWGEQYTSELGRGMHQVVESEDEDA